MEKQDHVGCPPDLAVSAIESSLTKETLLHYQKLFHGNRKVHDELMM